MSGESRSQASDVCSIRETLGEIQQFVIEFNYRTLCSLQITVPESNFGATIAALQLAALASTVCTSPSLQRRPNAGR
jgi:hypothetical protein